MSRRTFGCLIGLAAFAMNCPVAFAGPVSDYAIFGRKGVTTSLGTTDGRVGSDSNVTIGFSMTTTGVAAGGTVAVGGTVTGDVTGNGGVNVSPNSRVGGAVNTQGNATLTAGSRVGSVVAAGNVVSDFGETVTSNITAGGDVTTGNGSFVGGSVAGNGAVTINGTVNGSVTYGTTVATNFPGRINGTTSQGLSAVSPVAYSSTQLPTVAAFTAGGADVTGGGTALSPLAPGSYGALSVQPFGSIYLTAGDYYFTSFSMQHSTLNFVNVSDASRVNIFVTGDVNQLAGSTVTVNGSSFANADARLAADILLLTLGNYSQGVNPGSDFFGTLYAPNGNISTGFVSNFTGQMIAGGEVNLGAFFRQTFVAGSIAVPEPTSAALVALGLPLAGAGLAAGRRAAGRRRDPF